KGATATSSASSPRCCRLRCCWWWSSCGRTGCSACCGAWGCGPACCSPARPGRWPTPLPAAGPGGTSASPSPTGTSPPGRWPPPSLEAKEVSVHYGAVVALDAVSLSVQPGELVAIIGPNGAGKTTLFNCCSGFQAPGSGTVALRGIDVTCLPAHRRAAAGLGRSFQTPRLVDGMSVFENLLVGFHPRVVHGLPGEVAGFSYA